MIDREKVIKGLEYCVGHHLCSGCEYYDPDNARCQKDLMRDAFALMKEQEEVEPMVIGESELIGEPDVLGPLWFACGACGHAIDPEDNYCRECGRAVKWDD